MERSRELRGLVLAMYHDWSSADPTFLDLFSDSDDFTLIGTDPAEWFHGGRTAKSIFRTQVEEIGDIRITAGDLRSFAHGDVGWTVDNPTLAFGNGVSVMFRITGVYVREEGGWTCMHLHASIGTANEEALEIELTTSIDALAEWAEEAKPDLTPTTSPEGTVTIMFTDIESSTVLNERLGDDRWLEFIRHHDDLIRTTVASHGGATVKSAGDGFMVAFPSARKSVECAVAMQHNVAKGPDVPIRMRVGIHTGEPIRHRDDLFGLDVAYAARVGAVANGGEILVSNLVRQLCSGSQFDFEGPREFEFKGFEGAQPVYAVRW